MGNLRKQGYLAEVVPLGCASGNFKMSRMISNRQRPTLEQIVRGTAENYFKKYSTRSHCIMKFIEALAEVYFIIVRDRVEYFTKLSWLLRVTEYYILFVT